MILRQTNLSLEVVTATPGEVEWLRGFTTFPVAGASGKGDDYIFLFEKNAVPAGLRTLVEQGAREASIPLVVIDGRTRPLAPAVAPPLGWLREHQTAAVQRVVERERGVVWMPTGCLAGDTVIGCWRSGDSFAMSIRELVFKFNGGRSPFGKSGGIKAIYPRGWRSDIPVKVRCRMPDGYIRLNTLVGACSSGVKTVWCLALANGAVLKATADHRVMGADGWTTVGQLQPGDRVWAEVPRVKRKHLKRLYLVVSNLRAHPHAGRKNVGRSSGYSVPQHRLVAEARANSMALDVFVARIRAGDIAGLAFIDPKVYAVHHIDEDTKNNNPANLAVMTHLEHEKRHGQDCWRNVTAYTGLVDVVSVTPVGEEETYDLALAEEPHNFLANGMVVHNSGKGELIPALALAVPARWVVLVHRTHLLDDLSTRYRNRTGLEPGFIGDGVWNPRHVTFATLPTLHRARGTARYRAFAASIQAVLQDECHTSAADTYDSILRSFANAYWWVGLSATPLARGDRRSIKCIAAFGPVIHRTTPEELIQKGLLARPRIRAVAFPQARSSDADVLPWHAFYRAVVVDNPGRMAVTLQIIARARKPCMVFVTDIDHGIAITRAVQATGTRCRAVSGSASLDQRKAVLKALQDGAVDVVVASTVFNEGVDVKCLASVVIASSGKSAIAAVQRVGWATRPSPGKTEAEVWDISDVDHPTLHYHTRMRHRAYAKEGYTVEPMSLVALAAYQPTTLRNPGT